MFKKFALLVIGATLLFGGAARAQSNYPTETRIEVRDENGQVVGSAGVKVGDPLSVFSDGWAAVVDVQATWFSDPIDLGKHKSNAAGEVRFTFNVPDAPPVPGIHTLRLEGVGANGQFRRVEAPIKVTPADNGNGNNPTTSVPGNNPPTSVPGNNGNGNGGGNGNGSSVLGRTQENTSGNTGNLAFGKTGAELADMAKVGFTLMAVGAVLFLAVRKRTAATA